MDDHFNKTHLENCGFQLPCTDETSVLDLGYDTYTDNLGHAPAKIARGFLSLGVHLESLDLNENNAFSPSPVNCATLTRNDPSRMPSRWVLTSCWSRKKNVDRAKPLSTSLFY